MTPFFHKATLLEQSAPRLSSAVITNQTSRITNLIWSFPSTNCIILVEYGNNF